MADAFTGTILFIMAVTIITAVGISVLKILVTKVVSFGVEKKVENDEKIEKHARKSAVILFLVIAAVILILGSDHIAFTFSRPAMEVVFVGFLLLIFVLLVIGVIYRKPTEQLYNRARGRVPK
jgi:hypothetical protein